MVISSRTPEGDRNCCPICGHDNRVDPSRPPGDAPCPACGHLLWFPPAPAEPRVPDRRRLRHRVERALERLAALAESDRPPGEFYPELLGTALGGIGAPAGAVWIKSPQGFLQHQCQQNIDQVGLDDRSDGRAAHSHLLRFAFEAGRPGILGPRQRAEPDRAAGNPTDFALAVAPILAEDNRTVGLVEMFQEPRWNPQDLVTYTMQVAAYASNYVRNTGSG